MLQSPYLRHSIFWCVKNVPNPTPVAGLYQYCPVCLHQLGIRAEHRTPCCVCTFIPPIYSYLSYADNLLPSARTHYDQPRFQDPLSPDRQSRRGNRSSEQITQSHESRKAEAEPI